MMVLGEIAIAVGHVESIEPRNGHTLVRCASGREYHVHLPPHEVYQAFMQALAYGSAPHL